MAVATLWTLTMGSEEQRALWRKLKARAIADDKETQKSALKKIKRSISCFLQGLINIVADLLCGKGIYLNDLFPQSSLVVNTS